MALLICDSRGKGLHQHVTKHTNERVYISINSGATLYQSATRSRHNIRTYNPQQIYVLSGINNLTTINRHNRQVEVAERNPFKAADQFMEELKDTYTYIKSQVQPSVKIITAPVTGMSIASYNGNTTPNKADQQSLNDAVLEINKRIVDLNEVNGLHTPWTSAIVHRYFRKTYHFAYHRLSDDGCHLSDEVKNFWGIKLASAIKINIIC